MKESPGSMAAISDFNSWTTWNPATVFMDSPSVHGLEPAWWPIFGKHGHVRVSPEGGVVPRIILRISRRLEFLLLNSWVRIIFFALATGCLATAEDTVVRDHEDSWLHVSVLISL